VSVYVGLMSGTSLDGISAAVVRFRPDEKDKDRLAPELLAFRSVPYSSSQRARLESALEKGTAREYSALAFDLGAWFAEAAIGAIADAGVPRGEIRAIGSHGQTIWHDAPNSTWQLGESAVIAERTGIPVVSDFRVRDVAAGGQGAPLVPIADAILFSGVNWRALQNIGGIGNVTVVPPGGDPSGVRAFDTGPGVTVIDAVTRALFSNKSFDEDGKLAAAGTPVDSVVDDLLRHPYFSTEPPKSTGRELFDRSYVAALIADCRQATPRASNEDIVATATSLTARSIADSYRRFLPEPITEVLLSGGGAKNPTLFRMIERLLAPVSVHAFADRFFDGEAKEAVAFALLAHLHLESRPANVPRATGARGPRILGKLTPA